MLQALDASFHPVIAFAPHARLAIPATSDSERASLRQRLPRFERTAATAHAAPAGASFLDHLRGLASPEISRR